MLVKSQLRIYHSSKQALKIPRDGNYIKAPKGAFLLAKYLYTNMKFYNHLLESFLPGISLDWSTGLDDNLITTHIVHHLTLLNVDKTFCVCPRLLTYQNIQNINSSDTDYIVLNASDHPIDIYHSVFDFINVPRIFLNYNFNSKYYYPFWLLCSIYWSTFDVVDLESTKKYPVVFLNYKTRVPRLYTLSQLLTKSYYDKINTIWGPNKFYTVDKLLEDIAVNSNSSIYLEFDNMVPATQQFIDLHNTFNKTTDILLSAEDSVSDIANGMEDAYLQIVSESRPELNEFVSEKIFKPIRNGQLFLVQGSTGTIEHLRSIGFDVFDDYIDHSRYDNEPDWKRRTDLMLSLLDEIFPNIEHIYFNTVDRRRKNIELLSSGKLIMPSLSGILAQIHKYTCS